MRVNSPGPELRPELAPEPGAGAAGALGECMPAAGGTLPASGAFPASG